MTPLDPAFVERCANEEDGPVALTLRQKLVPAEGPDAVIFPPTYASVGYNIDTLSDGTKVVTVDSVGAQANRMEPIFKAAASDRPPNPYAELAPQVTITYGNRKSVSLFEVGHRLGDALVRSTALAEETRNAFVAYLDTGHADAVARLAPTSLVFGVWDSRDTNAKFPRIVQSVIRAWNVDTLERSAQYAPPVDYAELEVFDKTEQAKAEDDAKKAAANTKNPLAQRGFVHVPATGKHGGIVVRGEIRRDVTVNLVALRRLEGENGPRLRRYVFGLALAAVTAPFDSFLRQGCLLTSDPDTPATWTAVERSGQRLEIVLDKENALDYARKSALQFGVREDRSVEFDKALAKADTKKTTKDR